MFVTFRKWSADINARTLVSINPVEVSNVEDYCGHSDPGSVITLKNKKTYIVEGAHGNIMARLSENKDSVVKDSTTNKDSVAKNSAKDSAT